MLLETSTKNLVESAEFAECRICVSTKAGEHLVSVKNFFASLSACRPLFKTDYVRRAVLVMNISTFSTVPIKERGQRLIDDSFILHNRFIFADSVMFALLIDHRVIVISNGRCFVAVRLL
jgi:hypothetical protein